jgi:diacylglycerol kinase family enzyme
VSGIGVVLNPRSRRNLRDPRAAARLARRLGDHGVVRECASLDALYRTAEDFKKLEIDVLGISGGDGTNHVTITGFLDVYEGTALPQLAFLRGGTMNTVANSVGVRRGRPEGLLARVIRSYAARASMPALEGGVEGAFDIVERHVMRIGSVAPGSTPHYGFLFGTGVVAGFLAEYYRDEEPSPMVAAKTLARAIGSALVRGEMVKRMARPFRGTVSLESGGKWEERDYLAVAAGTIDQIGLGFRPFHRYAERPKVFHMVGIHATPMGFVRELPRIWRAEPMRPNKTYESVETRAIVRSTEPTTKYMIDGDLHETKGDIELAIGPRVKLFVVR